MLKLHVFYKEVTYRENVNWGGSLQGGPELDLPWALEGVWSLVQARRILENIYPSSVRREQMNGPETCLGLHSTQGRI